jgi:hypothetical protein
LYSNRKELIEGFNLEAPFAERHDYPKLTRDDRKQYDRLVVLAKRRKAKEARRVRDIWVRERVDAALVKVSLERRDAKRNELERVYGHAVEQGELTGDFLLWSHKFSEWVAVQSVLDNSRRYDGTQFADPMEPEHQDKRPAYANLKRTPPVLYSHFHGGMTYILRRERSKYVTVEKGERQIGEFLKLDKDKFVLITPGVGKTTMAIEDALRRLSEGPGVILYSMVNHKLIASTVKRIKPPKNVKIIHYHGRYWDLQMKIKKNQGKVRNCDQRFYPETEKARKLGYGEAEIACRRCDYAPWNGGKTCGFWKQFEGVTEDSRLLIFCPPQSIRAVVEKLTTVEDDIAREIHKDSGIRTGFDLDVKHIYIDEQSIEAVIERISPMTTDAIKTVQLIITQKAYEVVKAIVDLTDESVRTISEMGLERLKVYTHPLDGEIGLKDVIEEPIDPANLSLLRHELYNLINPPRDKNGKRRFTRYDLYLEGVNLNAVHWLYAFTRPTYFKNAWFDVDLTRADGYVSYQMNELLKLPDIPITILDATGSLQENEALFGRELELLEVNVGWKGTGVWLRKKLGQKEMRKLSEASIEQMVREDILEHIPAGARTGFLVTMKDREELVLDILKKLTPTIAWKSTYFWGARGLNDFEDCDVGLAFGFTYKHVGSLEDDSRTIFKDNLEARKQWEKVQNVNEHAQADHRLRLVRNPGRTLIVYGPIYPTELLGPYTVFEDYYDTGEFTSVELAAERVLDFIDKFGFCSKTYCLMMGIGRREELDKMSYLQECFLHNHSKHMSDCIYTIVSHMLKLGKDNIISTDQTFWQLLWSEVLLRRPSLKKLEVRHAIIDKRNYSHGLGDVESGKQMDASVAEYIPEFVIGKWRTSN